jgi:hypothetical protein
MGGGELRSNHLWNNITLNNDSLLARCISIYLFPIQRLLQQYSPSTEHVKLFLNEKSKCRKLNLQTTVITCISNTFIYTNKLLYVRLWWDFYPVVTKIAFYVNVMSGSQPFIELAILSV